jgi:hypothetical protein
MNLTTFRKNGAAVPTPVWFAPHEGKLYVVTGANLGKVKRIRNNPRVQVAPCTARGKPLGPPVDAVAREVPPDNTALQATAKQVLDQKYGLVKRMFEFLHRLSGRTDAPTYLEIAPA